MFAFQCNLCGADCQFELDRLDRETVSCPSCNSTPRTRAIVHLLGQKLLGQSIPLPQFPIRRSLSGLGMTDSENYAAGLAQKFTYQNTYFHKHPYLDIAAELKPEQLGSYDFVISSEVFEHVVPPVALAFANVFRLLKLGGLLIFTAPYGEQSETIEHFPDLHDFTIAELDRNYTLTNLTREGTMQKFDHLVFHGGPGKTLEMRIFAESDLLRHLGAAGFSEIEIHRQPCLQYGIWWTRPLSLPISARRPLKQS